MPRNLPLLICIFIVASCSQKKNEEQHPVAKAKRTMLPVVIKAGNPVITSPDTCPPPHVVAVPTSPGGTNIINTESGPQKIALAPPVSKPAGFFVNMQNYNTEQGLPLSNILCGFKDRKGNLWFGTAGGGVAKFNGKTFENFTMAQGLAFSLVWCIAEDRNSNMWFGTGGGGVSVYDGKSFTTYTTEQGLADNIVRSIVEDRSGNIWIGTADGGVSRFNPSTKKFTNYTTSQGLASNHTWCITEDKKGNMWIGTYGAGVSKFDGKTFKTYTTKDGLNNNFFRSILEDENGNIWFGFFGGGVSRYSAGNTGVKSFESFPISPDKTVLCITEDDEKNIWFGTEGGGVIELDGSASSTSSDSCRNTTGLLTTSFTKTQGLADDVVYSITQDNANNLWFGTFSTGLCRYEGKSIMSFSTAQGLPANIVYSIAEDKEGNLWLGTDAGGACKFQISETKGEKYFETFSVAQGLPSPIVGDILHDKKGNTWFGTYGGGVSKYSSTSLTTSGKTLTNYTSRQGLGNDLVWNMVEDRSGNIWFGTGNGGVSKFDGTHFETYTTKEGLVSNLVSNSTIDRDGNFWFTAYGGLSRFDGKSFINFTTKQGLIDKTVLCVTEDKFGNIWCGTLGGLCVITKEKLEKIISKQLKTGEKIFETFTSSDGLSNDAIAQIAEDKNGNMFIGTNNGITVVHPTRTKLLGDAPPEIYNSKTGYPIKDINGGNGALRIDSKGIVWAGTGDKLIRFDYSAIHKDTIAPNVFIQHIKINNENVCWNDLKNFKSDTISFPPNTTEEISTFGRALTDAQRDILRKKFGDIQFDGIERFYSIPENLVLPFNHNNVTFDFAATAPSRNFLVRYQYVLEGYDNEWNPVSDKATATFGNIHEGVYTFKLKAQSPDCVWSEPISYKFKVLPPWYRTWWMYLIYTITVLIALGAYIKWRQRNLVKEKEALERTVKERTEKLQVLLGEKEMLMKEIHHRVKNNLEVISSLLELQSEAIDDNKAKAAVKEGQSRVQSIALIHHKLYRTDDIASVEFKSFANDLYKQVESVFRRKDIEMELKILADETKISIDTAVPLGLILNELLTNTFKYGVSENRKNIIILKLSESENEGERASMNFKLLYCDNGPGLPVGYDIQKSTSLGMKVIQLLTKQLGGKLNFYNDNGIVFEIPFVISTEDLKPV